MYSKITVFVQESLEPFATIMIIQLYVQLPGKETYLRDWWGREEPERERYSILREKEREDLKN